MHQNLLPTYSTTASAFQFKVGARALIMMMSMLNRRLLGKDHQHRVVGQLFCNWCQNSECAIGKISRFIDCGDIV